MTRLLTHGDDYEKIYWNRFIKTIFPNYEQFWIQNIVDITDRPNSIHISDKDTLKKSGKGDPEVQVAQLHYTVFRHLVRVYEILRNEKFEFDNLSEGFLRLCSALEVGYELILRFKFPSEYKPWTEYRQIVSDWNNKNYYSPKFIQDIRFYRNFLTHCNLMPSMLISEILYVPKIGLERSYYDWRKIASVENAVLAKSDFKIAHELLNDAWDEVVKYLDYCWQMYLIKTPLPLSLTDIDKVEPPSKIIVASGNNYHIQIGNHITGTSGFSYINPEPKTMVIDTNAATIFDPNQFL